MADPGESRATLRRDLLDLEKADVVQRVHGGHAL
ncbi:DeoR family transcriptional regulator [Paraburkholderia guartelaensis]